MTLKPAATYFICLHNPDKRPKSYRGIDTGPLVVSCGSFSCAVGIKFIGISKKVVSLFFVSSAIPEQLL